MHELGIMTGVLSAVEDSAKANNVTKVLAVNLTVGEMTEAIEDALRFAFEAITPGTVCEGAELVITMVKPYSRCYECGKEYEHSRFDMVCPHCGSGFTELIRGRELYIDSIEVETPDEDAGKDDA